MSPTLNRIEDVYDIDTSEFDNLDAQEIKDGIIKDVIKGKIDATLAAYESYEIITRRERQGNRSTGSEYGSAGRRQDGNSGLSYHFDDDESNEDRIPAETGNGISNNASLADAFSNALFSLSDDYMDAVNRGDMDEADALLRQWAEQQGYP